jgi:cis-zeatin O-glucosyltransferase
MYDVINAFAAEEAARLPNGEGFAFHCTAASSIAWHMDGGAQLMRDVHGLDDLPVHAFVTEEFLEFIGKRARSAQTIPSSAGVIMNTSRALEGEFIDLVTQQLAAAGGKKVFSVGPINPMLGSSAHGPGATRHECLGWLDKQPTASVLYVSFGSMSSLRGEQIKELATALRGSNQRFIWVLRDADRADIYSESGESRHAKFLSEFTKETEGTGLVITGWAPQLEILAHGATAAFLSHCGWNSTMESRDENGTDIFRPYSRPNPFRVVQICPYPSPDIQHPIPYPYPNI